MDVSILIIGQPHDEQVVPELAEQLGPVSVATEPADAVVQVEQLRASLVIVYCSPDNAPMLVRQLRCGNHGRLASVLLVIAGPVDDELRGEYSRMGIDDVCEPLTATIVARASALLSGVPIQPAKKVLAGIRLKRATGAQSQDLAIRQQVLSKHAQAMRSDYFAFLGVDPDADDAQLQEAAQALQQLFASADFPGELRSELRAEISEILEIADEAWRVLREPVRRQAYRATLSAQRGVD